MKNNGLWTWIERRKAKSHGEVAVIAGDVSLRYEEFAERIARFANALAARGVGKGDRVAYLGDNHPDFLTTFFACGAVGAIFKADITAPSPAAPGCDSASGPRTSARTPAALIQSLKL